MEKLTPPNNEDDIKSYWKYTDKVYISCICIAYNHELYIKDSLDSILAQISEYRFEIIIHDDLSTDKTRDILLEYKNKFPNIIKLILQKENQFSQGKKLIPIAASEAIGDYICLCEGDDYWINKNKIQKQFEELEKNKNLNICFTAAKGLNLSTNKYTLLSNHSKNNKYFTCSDIIRGGGDFMPTASIMLRKCVFENLPQWYLTAPVGDYFLQIYGASNGALFLSNITSIYRVNSVGSWSASQKKNDENKIVNFCSSMTHILNSMRKDNINNADIDYAISAQELIAAQQLIKKKSYKKAKELIVTSWKRYPAISFKHNVMYYSRNFLSLIYLLFIIKFKYTQ
ncbi:glycosyltransferase [Proteus vulgaris]|uniref:glycosyltransferase n=1 Tax=Proteus vulgaris TaxID=585 RepID=UPI001B3855BF|nr:glycosyltransferase [Proteus vulgaris]MBQ0215601.1 glycosyltransferase [Proteus vulgaris]